MNVGTTDKSLRLGAGLVLLAIAFLALGGLASTSGLIATIVGGILVATGLFNFCPAYKLLGMNTRSK